MPLLSVPSNEFQQMNNTIIGIYNISQSISSWPFTVSLSPQPPTPDNHWCDFCLKVLPFLECHINGIIECIAFGVWLLSLIICFWDLLILLHASIYSFLLLVSVPLYGCTTNCLSNHKLIDVWVVATLELYCFTCRSLLGLRFHFLLGKYLETGLLGHMTSLYFNFIRKFQHGCTILHSHHQWMSVPIALHPHQPMVLCLCRVIPLLV